MRPSNQRKPGRSAVQEVGTQKQLNVTASQNVVAERSGFERLTSALGTALPKVAEAYAEGERERLDLAGKQFGLDVMTEMDEAYERTWKNSENAAEEIDAYYSDSLAKLPDNQMRKAALSYMDRARAAVHQKHNTFLAEEDKIKRKHTMGSIFQDTAINGGGLGTNGMAHFMEYGRTQNLTDRELGAIAMEQAILHASTKGDTSILDGVSEYKVDDVALGSVYKEEAMKARGDADVVNAKNWTLAEARQLEEWENKAKDGTFGTDEDLLRAKALGLTRTKVVELMTKNNASRVEDYKIKVGVAAYLADNSAPRGSATSHWNNIPSTIKAKAANVLFDEAAKSGDTMELLRIANTTGQTYEPWKFRLNQRSLVTKEEWDGTVPQTFLEDHNLYQTLRTSSPNALRNHMTNQAAEAFHKSYDFAKQRGMTDVQAYGTALQLSNTPFNQADFPHVDFREVGTHVTNVITKGFNAENNLGYINTWMNAAAKQNIRLGADQETAVKGLDEEFRSRHTKINGTWVPTYGKPVPADAEDVMDYAINKYIDNMVRQDKKLGAEGIEYNPDDYYAMPDPTAGEGVWLLMEKPQRIVSKFDVNNTRQEWNDLNAPDPITPEDFIGKRGTKPPSLRENAKNSPYGRAARDVFKRDTTEEPKKQAPKPGLREHRDAFSHLEPDSELEGALNATRAMETNNIMFKHLTDAIRKSGDTLDKITALFKKPERGGDVKVREEPKAEPVSFKANDKTFFPSAQASVQAPKRATLNHNAVQERIRHHEGYRSVSYPDAAGRSIGNGIFLGEPGNPPKHVKELIEAEGYDFDAVYAGKVAIDEPTSKRLFETAYNRASQQAPNVASNFEYLPAPVQGVIIEMVYQMGLGSGDRRTGVMGFPKFRKALEESNFEVAAAEMLDSKWAREDSPGRAKGLARILRNQ